MSLRKLVVWGFVILVVVLAVLSYFGNRIIFYVYVGLLVPFLIFHAVAICRRCTNVYCAFNAKSADYFLRLQPHASGAKSKEVGYSDINARLAGTPLALIVALSFIAVWQLSMLAFFATLAYAAVAMVIYMKETCRFCTNNCPNNKNVAYWKWKRQRS